MARIVEKHDVGPKEIKAKDGTSFWICMCGISKNQPFCDGNHKKTADEVAGKVYKYDKDGTRVEVTP